MEHTIIDKSLTMSLAVANAIKLKPRSIGSRGVGPVLRKTIQVASIMGAAIKEWRQKQRDELDAVAESLKPITARLQQMVPEHGREICRQVDYALLYVVHEAIEYVDAGVVDGLLFGFQRQALSQLEAGFLQ